MNSFNDYKEEIYKCSKCGLCQSVCPVYEVTKNECAVSRGKFILLNGIMQNEINLNESIINNLDLCLNCNACKEFCPSDINAKEIFACVKNEYNKQKKSIIFLNSVKIFEFKLGVLKILINSYRFLNLDKLTLSKYFLSLNSIISIKSKRKKTKKTIPQKGKILFFEGCFNKYINPSSKNASINLFEELGYEVLIPNTNCCGIHSYYSGHFTDFEKNAKSNIGRFPKDIDYIISDCDSCLSTLKLYDDFLKPENKISPKIISLSKLLIDNEFQKKSQCKTKITYHKPCHYEYPHIELLESLKGINYSELKNNSCCGFAGDFALKHKEISKKITGKKAKEIIENNPEIVVTTCPSCIIGIKQGLLSSDSNIQVLSLPEFLDL